MPDHVEEAPPLPSVKDGPIDGELGNVVADDPVGELRWEVCLERRVVPPDLERASGRTTCQGEGQTAYSQ